MTRARAVACANIALAKYWGKASVERNLTAVPSLSLTLEALRTTTSVEFSDRFGRDEAFLDGVPVGGRPLARIIALLDRVRAIAAVDLRASVQSQNDFPTAAGLASSASGFAALALAATRAAGLEPTLTEVSRLAREASASAARSVFGGWVALAAGAEHAERIAPADHLPLTMLVAITTSGPKKIGSTEGMQHTAATSPYYPGWLEHAPRLFDEIRRAVLDGDLPTLGAAMEQSALMMHASMMAARPALIYFSPATLGVVERVRQLRAAGISAFYTMDAGPHVKVLTAAADAESVTAALAEVPGVERMLCSRPGPDASVELEEAP